MINILQPLYFFFNDEYTGLATCRARKEECAGGEKVSSFSTSIPTSAKKFSYPAGIIVDSNRSILLLYSCMYEESYFLHNMVFPCKNMVYQIWKYLLVYLRHLLQTARR
jgi:hypothetical protein